jgi:HlyD family secretion protein
MTRKSSQHNGTIMRSFKLFGPALIVAALAVGCGGGSKGANPSGTLEATEVDLSSLLSGRILEVRPQLGDHVKAGDTLVVLDVELLELQRAQSAANRQSIEAQERIAEDGLHQTQQNLDLAQSTFTRQDALLQQGSATPQQVDEVRTRRDVAAAQSSAALHQIGALSAEMAKLDALLAVYDRQIRDGTIVAPQNGTVILRNAEPGETATPGSVLLRIADLTSLDLRVYLGERDLARVKLGQEIPVLVDALNGKSITGKVTWVSSEAEFTPKNAQTKQARTQLVYAVKVRLPNTDGKLDIGMPAEVKL